MIDLKPFVAELDANLLAAAQRLADAFTQAGATRAELPACMRPFLQEAAAQRAAVLARLMHVALKQHHHDGAMH